MALIYNAAFRDAEVQNDEIFSDHVKSLAKVITVDHGSLQISHEHRSEAPWPAAQQELLRMGIYKSPRDKLRRIEECCKCIVAAVRPDCRSVCVCADGRALWAAIRHGVVRRQPSWMRSR